MPCNVFFGLTISPVTYRLTCSNPSARRNKSRYGRSPLRIVSGTPTIGSITPPSSSSVVCAPLYLVLRGRTTNPPSRVYEAELYRLKGELLLQWCSFQNQAGVRKRRGSKVQYSQSTVSRPKFSTRGKIKRSRSL